MWPWAFSKVIPLKPTATLVYPMEPPLRTSVLPRIPLPYTGEAVAHLQHPAVGQVVLDLVPFGVQVQDLGRGATVLVFVIGGGAGVVPPPPCRGESSPGAARSGGAEQTRIAVK